MPERIIRDGVEYKFLERCADYDIYEHNYSGKGDSKGGIISGWRNSRLHVLAMGGEILVSNSNMSRNGVTFRGIPLDKKPLVLALFEDKPGPMAKAIVKRLK